MKRTITFLMLLLMAGLAMAQGTFTCGDPVIDGSGNVYETVKINGLCWTKSNMRAVSYADGSPIANAMIYNSNLHPDTTANLANFGRLYTWWSAVNLPEGSDAAPAKDATGFVRGVCPAGWHIPTVADIQKLRTYADEDLHSTDFWVMPNSNTNSTGFSEVPGGMFSAERNRFEGLLSNSYMWTDSSSRREWVVACNSRYFCDKASEEYVKKGDGLSVRCVFAMEICPLVTTIAADECDMKYTTAVLKGSATDLEGTLQEYGIMWGLTKNALTNTQLATSITNGNFEATLTGLPACGDTVYYSAFVKQSSCNEIVYGDTLMFVVCGHGQDAKPCLLAPTVTDHENNVYNTVQIGNQCWMRENLRTTTSPSTGNRLITDNSTDRTFTGKQARWYGNDSAQYAPQNYGLLYNWNAAVDTFNSTYGEFSVNDTTDYAVNVTFTGHRRGICPEGWHLPSDAEWDTLKKYVSSQSQYICGSNNSYIAKSLASTTGWLSSDNSCAVGNVLNTNNKTGFSAVPAGNNVGAQFNHKTNSATFWSSTQAENKSATNHYMLHNSAEVNEHNNLKSYGFSVRCIKDACEDNAVNATLPTVTTKPVQCDWTTGGNVTDDGGAEVILRGVCWDTNSNPTIDDKHTVDGSGIGDFSSIVADMKVNKTYYVRAYAINSAGVAYGNEETYIYGASCPGTPTATDHENNVYNTVKIGNQCWTRENMRCTTSPSGKIFNNATTDVSRLTPMFYNNTASAIAIGERGMLYNWAAALDTVFTAGTDASFTNRRGICPEGWHLPSRAEWQTLIDYTGTVECYTCGGDASAIAKSLAYNGYWANSNGVCHIGNNLSSNNNTGFSAIPTGFGNLSSPFVDTLRTRFWSSTGNNTSTSFGMTVNYNMANVSVTSGYDQNFGFAVRCLKDVITTNCPTVTTTAATNVSSDSAKINGVVTNVSGTVENYGFVWGTSKNTITTTVNGTSVTAMTADGDFSSIIKGLTPCDTIWYAAFAKTSECGETVYGDTLTFKVPVAAPDYTTCGTVKDHENNEYNTVKIGDQCWTRENMRCTTSPTGKTIQDGQNIIESNTNPYYYNNTSSSIPLRDRGIHYNYSAAMDTVITDNVAPKNHRGICPEGWHIPDSSEFAKLREYVKLQGCYICGGDENNITKSLASTTYWENDLGVCQVGYSPSSTNNATGFSVIPAGHATNVNGTATFHQEHRGASLWCSDSKQDKGHIFAIGYNSGKEKMLDNPSEKSFGRSVRCLKNADNISYDGQPCPGTPTVTDVDGNTYNTVQIGNQCWMKENLRTTKYADSTAITTGGSSVSNTVPYYYNTTFSNIDSVQRGYLYNWAAATRSASTRSNNPSNAQGICPTGWHLPSKAEWDTLTNYVSSIPEYLCDGTNANIAKALASKTGWSQSTTTCAVGNDTTANNKTGFSAVPVGRCLGSTLIEVGYEANFWSSTLHEDNFAFSRYLNFNNAKVLGGTDGRNYGLSVRCLKDADTTATDNCPVITRSGYSVGLKDSVALTGIANNIIGDVTDYGFVYGYSRDAINRVVNSTHPKVTIRQYTDKSIFTYSKLDSVPQCDSVYFVAFLKTDGCSETVYSDTVSFIIKPNPQSCGDVTDVDGNYYHTVQLGSQCWMTENLRTKHFKDGTAIAQGADTSFTIPYYYQPAPAEVTDYNFDDYGLYYNFASVESPKGICPEGWHVPTRSEWDTLSNYVGSQCAYVCGNNDNNFAKALSSHFGWKDSDAECAVGNNQSTNNITSFGAIPMGRYNADAAKFDGVGEYSYFWTSTGYGTNTHYELTNAWTVRTIYFRPYGLSTQYTKTYGFPIRCLRDEATTPTVVIDSLSCPEAKTVTDHEGNVYATVKIGNQCWTRENLRTTTSPSTKTNLIPADGVDYTFTGKQARWYGNDSSQYAPLKYGLLYNWNAAVDTFNTTLGELNVSNNYDYAVSVTFDSHRRGICPEGWHVPSDAEWNTMEQTVSGSDWQDIYANTNGWRGSHAGKLASGDKWNYSLKANAPGDTSYSDRNKSGFSAFPVGKCYGSWSGEAGVNAYFWSSTQMSGSNGDAWSRQIGYYDVTVYRTNYFKCNGFSVRCVKDNDAVIDSLSCPEAKTVTDVDNNAYATVKIGNQCWTRQNLRTTKYANGTAIPAGGGNTSYTDPYYYEYPETETDIDLKDRGLLYNWSAANLVCPTGWHLPSDAEWNIMEKFVSGSDTMNVNFNATDWRGSHAGKLAGGDKWMSMSSGNVPGNMDYAERNAFGFSAVPAGGCFGSLFDYAGGHASFWSSTQDGSYGAWLRGLDYYNASVGRVGIGKNLGYSVRCVKDADTTATDNCPEIIQALYDRIEVDSVALAAFAENIIGDVTDYGFVYGYSRDAINRVVNSTHPRVTISHYSDVSIFDYDKLDSVPQCGSVYFVAFLKTDGCSETVYSDTVSFIIKPYTQNCGTVTDADGNTYETVQLGSQCWMKSNLRTTKYADSTEITAGGDNVSATEAYYYDNTSSNIALEQRGYFYNWAAAMNGASSSNATPSGVQGICPDGWHLPSHAEWDALMNYVRSNSCYICGGNSENIAKALASTTGWEDHNGTCRVGNDQTLNNATEFSSVPAGNYYGMFQGLLEGTQANFWSSREDENDPNRAWCVLLRTYDKILNSSNNSKNYGYSIRCLKDADADTLCAPVGDAKPCPGTPTVTDHENNVYNTVQIGDQCWMKENMRCTTSPSGKTQFQAASGSSSYVSPQYYDSESSIPLNDRGLLYNWAAAMDTVFTSENEMNVSFINRRGICPEGWHVPTDNEWTVFENYVKTQDCYHCNDTSDYIAKALSSTKYWKEDDFMSCLVGNDLTKNNATGFSAVPAGMCRFPNYYLDSMQVSFWSSTSASDYGAYFRNIMSHERVVTREAGNDKNTSYSVRCVKDEVVVIDSLSCPEAKTVTDHEGNTYATVRIGNQCWTRQNMRATKYADGRSIPAGGGRSNTEPYYYNYTSSGIDLKDRGLLYNWTAAMDSAASSNAVPSGVQGICPTGWHVPSDAEWNLMEQTVSNDFGNWVEFSALRGSHAGKLAGGDKWQTSSNANAPGDTNYTDRNASGFSAVPAGYSFGSSFYYAGDEARFWTSTQYSDTRAWKRDLIYINTQVFRDYDDKYCGYSVRCLKDEVVVIDSLSCPEAKTVTDHEGNVYATVKIGNQCWTRENLRTTTSPSTGTYLVTTNNTLTYTGKQARWYGYDSSQYAPLKYGLLYNWNAAVDTFNTTFGETSVNNVPVSVTFTGHRRGICPEGWHLPSNAEWDTLKNYVGNNLGANNATGFSAVLAGSHTGSFTGKNINAFFWSSTQDDSNTAWRRILSNNNVSMGNNKLGKDNSFSVRCVKDEATTTTVVIDSLSCPEAKTVTDIEGNMYATVKIGNQCWMRQNMRATKYADGTDVLAAGGDIMSDTLPYYYDYISSGIDLNKRGYLYNWAAVMHNDSSSNSVPSGVQGICPTGWHVPSDAEWDTLTTYVGSQSTNILTNFTTVLSGYCEGWDFGGAGSRAYFWSSTQSDDYNAWYQSSNGEIVLNQSVEKVVGFSVRCLKDENGSSAATMPTVTTAAVSNIADTSATCGGEVTDDGGANVTARGVCWSTSPNPTIDSAHTSDGIGIGSFGSNITGLTAGTTYYVRAYATNSAGTAYGNEVTFVTSGAYDAQPCPGVPTVTDYDGNVYNTVQIGNQCWMKENLRTTKYANGADIPAGGSNTSSTDPYYYDNTSSGIDLKDRGYFYNWPAVMRGASFSNTNPSNVQGICPSGWHLPSKAEWLELLMYANSQMDYLCESTNEYLAKALASESGWNNSTVSCTPGNNPSENNATGFSAVPVGRFWWATNQDEGKIVEFWSASMGSSGPTTTYAQSFIVRNWREPEFSDAQNKSYALSVRCIRGAVVTPPSVTTAKATDVTDTSATLNGTVINYDNVPITSKGFEWKTTEDGTYTQVFVTDSALSYVLNGLTSIKSYTYRAFITTASDTCYGSEETFVTSGAYDAQPCPGVPTVTDYEGNVYNTVHIGNKCWMKENLRSTKYSDGTEIPAGGSSTSDAQPYYYDYVTTYGPAIPLEQRGYLYNWPAAMNGASSSNTIPSNVQGVCPSGWHLPSNAEWIELTDYVRSQSKFRCNVNDKYDNAKALASEIGWAFPSGSTGYCVPDNDPGTNNATGFSAIPIAFCEGRDYINEWSTASFWSSTFDGNRVRVLRINKNSQYVNLSGSDFQKKQYGLSVRCVKDTGNTSLGAQPCPGTPTVTDVDNNVYNTVQIGDQCWMKENMRATKYSDGTDIPAGGNNWSYTAPYYYDYTSSGIDLGERGYLYNWAAANRVCPDGWHLPSDAEWNTMEKTVSGSDWLDSYATVRGHRGSHAGKLAGGDKWNSSTDANTPGNMYYADRNASGFSAVPAGSCFTTSFFAAGYSAIFWSSTQYGSQDAWRRVLYYYNALVLRDSIGKGSGYSVRCLKNNTTSLGAQPCPGTPTVTDVDNNVYNTVQIGDQCWMKENMRATKYSDGTDIPAGGSNWSTTDPYYYDYTSSGIDLEDRGYLYNWAAANRVCPDGWHLPSDAEWNTMEKTVSGSDWLDSYATVIGHRGSHAGKLAGGDKWNSSTDANTPGNMYYADRNASGFSAVPAGNCFSTSFSTAGYSAIFWSSTQYDNYFAWRRLLSYSSAYVHRDSIGKGSGYSVRCLKNNTTSLGAQPCPGTPTVTDVDNNVYNTVQIGDQCWMKENMRATKYSDGTEIPAGSNASSIDPYYYNYTSGIDLEDRGYLYNWPAATRKISSSLTTGVVQGVCPNGWHVPSDAEWDTLMNYVGNQNEYKCGDNSGNIAKALATATWWRDSDNTCATGNNQSKNNYTGFSAVPAGYYDGSYFVGAGDYAEFWSSTQTQYNSNNAYDRFLFYAYGVVNGEYLSKSFGFSVRCLKDAATTPTVVIDEKSCSEAPTVTDHEGNVYATVKIGNQCWMRENLRTTTSPSTGTYIVNKEFTSGTNIVYTFSGKMARWYDNDSATYAPMKYGLLYNWNAAVDTFNTAFNETNINNSDNNAVDVSFTGHRKGICPKGWHLPTGAEWTTLRNYVSSQPGYLCNGNSNNIAKALADSVGWYSATNVCRVGYNQNENNATGFSAKPAGYYTTLFTNRGSDAAFWTATQSTSILADYRKLTNTYINIYVYDISKANGYSVRCLKDN